MNDESYEPLNNEQSEGFTLCEGFFSVVTDFL